MKYYINISDREIQFIFDEMMLKRDWISARDIKAWSNTEEKGYRAVTCLEKPHILDIDSCAFFIIYQVFDWKKIYEDAKALRLSIDFLGKVRGEGGLERLFASIPYEIKDLSSEERILQQIKTFTAKWVSHLTEINLKTLEQRKKNQDKYQIKNIKNIKNNLQMFSLNIYLTRRM